MISYLQAVVLGLLQGFSELFPISSLGHAVVLPSLLGWKINQNDPFFLTFLVGVHLATALVLVGFFASDWVRIVRGLVRSIGRRRIDDNDSDARLAWLLIAGTIPAGLLGLAFEHTLREIFASAQAAAVFLALNGIMLYGAEQLRRRAFVSDTEGDADTRISQRISLQQAFAVGAVQVLALIPGFSRSGAAMGGGLLAGLSNRDAARFAFLLATPIIAAAAVLKLPALLGPQGDGVRGQALVGAICAGVTAYLAVRFLMRFFETNRLTPFAIYSFVAGVLLSIYFAVS